MNTIKIKCHECGIEFEKNIIEYDRQTAKGRSRFFCTLSWSVKTQQKESKLKNIIEYNRNPKLCLNCNLAIDYEHHTEKKFCNHSCAAVFNNAKRIIVCDSASEKTYRILPIKKCKHCNQSTKRFYCSSECQHKEIIKNTNLKIENGNRVGPIQFKRYLSEKRGHKCEMCGLSEWGNKQILLVLDHIDGNSENCSLQNLRQICSNCDTLTPTYKGRNKGKGRFARKQRYHAGKSF